MYILSLLLLILTRALTPEHTQAVCPPVSCVTPDSLNSNITQDPPSVHLTSNVTSTRNPLYACRGEKLMFTCEVLNAFSLQWASEPDICRNFPIGFSTGDYEGERKPRGSYQCWLISVAQNPPNLTSALTFTPNLSDSVKSITVQCGDQLSSCTNTKAEITVSITDKPVVANKETLQCFIKGSCPNVSAQIQINEIEDIAGLNYELTVSSPNGCALQECPMLLSPGKMNITLLDGVHYNATLVVSNDCGSGNTTVLIPPVCEGRTTDPPKTPANSTTIGGDVVVGAAISGLLVGAGGAISVALCIDCYRKKKKVKYELQELEGDHQRRPQEVQVKMKEDHEKELQILELKMKEDHEKELQTLEMKRNEDHAKELQTLELKMKEDHEKELQTLEVKMKEDHAKELQTLEMKRKENHEKELQTLEVKMKEDHAKELQTLEVKMKEDHEKELQTLEMKRNEDHEKELQTLEMKMKEDHEKELQTLELKMKEDHEKELQTLEGDHQRRLQEVQEEMKRIHERARKRSRRRRHILLQDKDVSESSPALSGSTEYPLHMAAKKGNLEKVKQLVNEGANINIKDNDERTPLHVAVERALTEIVKHLVDSGANITIKDYNGMTPFHVAAERGRCEEILGYLIDKGGDASINIKDEEGRTPLHVAVSEGQESTVKFLVDRKADLTIKDYRGMTPFHAAAERGRCEKVLGLLIDEGGDACINIKNEDGRTPLHVAVEEGEECTVESLVENFKADINSKDSDGMTPLHVAVERGDRINIMKYLLNKGADIDSTDNYGWTPIHIAAKEGHEYSVRTLVKKGADISIKDDSKMTPQKLADESGHVNIMKFLEEEERSHQKIDEFPRNINMMDGMKVWKEGDNIYMMVYEDNETMYDLQGTFEVLGGKIVALHLHSS